MKPFWSRALAALAAALVALGVAAATAGPAVSADATTFSGRATVVKGKVLGVPVGPLADTGNVSPGGGELETSLLCYPDGTNCTFGLPDATGGTLNATVLHAAVVAHGNTSRAEATVATVGVTVLGHTINAEFISARAEAKCTGGTATVKGDVEIVELTIDNQTIDVGTRTNFRVDLLGGGFVILNEQNPVVSGGNGQIDVNAIRIVIPGVLGPETDTDLTIAAAHADIACAALLECPGKHAFVTGGGFINLTKQHFAVAGRDGAAWGHVMWKPTKLHVKRPFAKVFRSLADLDAELGTRPFKFTTSMLADPSAFEGAAILWWLRGDGSIAGQALAIDMGEPGRSDYFEIAGDGAAGGGFLGGGNIQMHGKCTGSGV